MYKHTFLVKFSSGIAKGGGHKRVMAPLLIGELIFFSFKMPFSYTNFQKSPYCGHPPPSLGCFAPSIWTPIEKSWLGHWMQDCDKVKGIERKLT